jgi:hypothetical protein
MTPADAAAAAVPTAAALLVINASWGYLSEVRARTADPRLASWAIFTAALGVGAAGSAVARQWPSACLTAAGAVTCAAILAAGWRHGDREFGRLDSACAVLGIEGLLLLTAAVMRPRLVPVTVVVAASVVTDLAAFAPMFVNGWRGEEPWKPFIKLAVAAAATLAVTDLRAPAGVIYPGYEVVVNMAMAMVVLASPARRRMNPSPQARR